MINKIKKFIEGLYEEILFSTDKEYNRPKLMELCRLINLDLFLRGIFRAGSDLQK